MSDQPTFQIPPIAQPDGTTGRLVVTFRDDSVTEGMSILKKTAGISKLPTATDYENAAITMEQVDAAGGAVFPTVGIAIITPDDSESVNNLMMTAGEDGAIIAIEPERLFYALGDGTLPLSYLRGYRDAVNHLYEAAVGAGGEGAGGEAAAVFLDDAQSTWGLKATRVVGSRNTGRGIKVAILDTGLDLRHPDLVGRSITSQSFVTGEAVQDGNSHGTHCTGTSTGKVDVNGRRYGCASDAAIFIGKVLGNAGSGTTGGIIAGIDWAIGNGCQVISMSLGNTVATPSTAYETIGQRALQRGCLIVAAAGNHRSTVPNPPGTVGQPANSPSIMAVAAVDNRFGLASFSCSSGGSAGANVDIAGPGVNVYSSVPMPRRYDGTFSGTSMATPHVAGIAAMWAQARGARGAQLWQLLTSQALRLSLSGLDVGAGLVQAPQ